MKREVLTIEFYKPKLFVLVLLFAMPFLLGSGCSTNADLKEEPVPFKVLRAVFGSQAVGGYQNVVSCKFNYENIDPDSNNKEGLSGLELVIDSQADFDTYISCDDTVSVNFEEEFVLAGMTTPQPTEVWVKEQTVELVNDSLYYRTGILKTDATRPSGADYIVKVLSTDYLEYPVVFDIYWEGGR
ncbi:MAG: hypothetical protein WD059_08525 [Balneolaceae bacterium]